jgi:glycosyltransferase involved in cell wall biosynthesis
VKILQVVPSYLPGFRYGGPIRSVHGLSRALAARGHEVTVCTTDVDDGQRLAVPTGAPVSLDGVEVRYFRAHGPRRLRYAPSLWPYLARVLPEYDLVHVHGLFHWFGCAAARAARGRGVPYVIAPRGMLVDEMLARRGRLRKRLWLEWLERPNLGGAAALHLTAELERDCLPVLPFPLPQAFVLENGVEHTPFGGELSAVDGLVRRLFELHPRVLLFLGRLNWKKGLDRLLAALRQVPPDVHLAIAGPDDGGGAQLRGQVFAQGLERRVTLVGPVTGETRAFLLERATLLVLPSYSENFGNVVLEALAAGTPAVVTPEVGAGALLERTGAGRILSGDPELLGAGLAELLADPAALALLRSRTATASSQFAWPTIAARAELEFERVLRQSA